LEPGQHCCDADLHLFDGDGGLGVCGHLFLLCALSLQLTVGSDRAVLLSGFDLTWNACRAKCCSTGKSPMDANPAY
jgi:hypothetical protein